MDLVTGSTNWLHDDHFEVWVQTNKKLYQWGIRIADGKVFRAYGNPTVDPVVEVTGTDTHRLRVTLPFEPDRFSFSYSVGMPDGSGVYALVGSTPIKFGYADSLGSGHSREIRCMDGPPEWHTSGTLVIKPDSNE